MRTTNKTLGQMREANDLMRTAAKMQKARGWWLSNVATYGGVPAACQATGMKDEAEFVKFHAANCEVFWNPLTRCYM